MLASEPLGLRARDVHARVELLLGERVSRSSVKSMLALRCQGENRLFERLGHGHYKPVREKPNTASWLIFLSFSCSCQASTC